MLHGLAVARLYRSRIRTANIQLALQPVVLPAHRLARHEALD
jgi:hypothetical protein